MRNLYADYLDRYFYYRGLKNRHEVARQKAINEMKAFNLIKNEQEIWNAQDEYLRKQNIK